MPAPVGGPGGGTPVGGGAGGGPKGGGRHTPIGPQKPTIVKPQLPTTTLPDWWAIVNQSGGTGPYVNYGDIQFPISGAIAPDQLLPVCYGQVRIGGTPIGFGGVTVGDTTHGWGAIVWCEGEIGSVDAFGCNGVVLTQVDDTASGSWRHFTHYVGDGTQYTQDNTSDLFCPGPRSNPAGVGGGPYETVGLKTAAYTRVDLYKSPGTGQFWWYWLPNANVNGAGTYEWFADVHGLKIYDPRGGGSTGYSNNPALIARDIITRYGKAQVDDASIIAAADACDTAGFTCNVAFAAKTSVKDALAVVLQTCNGMLITSDGKIGIALDIVNAGAPVATLSEADGDIWNLNYEWISSRDRYTSVIVTFANSAADYKPDQTPPFSDPGIALGVVPEKLLTVTAPGINTLAAAIILRDYLFNSQAVTFRATGTMNASGILLQQGQKIHLTTLKGVDADFILLQVVGDEQGFFNIVAKPYLAAVYGTTPITQNPPVTGPPGVDPDAPPPPAAPRHQSGFGLGSNKGIAFDAPRVYAPSGPYSAGDLTISGTGASGDASKINDGITNVVAATSTDTLTIHLDRGVVVPQVFGRVNFWIDADLAVFLQYGTFAVEYSDDDASWTDALTSGAGYLKTCPWQDTPVAGIYPCHIEIPDSIGAHRYWRMSFFGIAAGVGTLNLYELSWETYTAYTGTVVGYELRTWVGESYTTAYPNVLGDYLTPQADAPIVLRLGTLPTDGSPFVNGDIPPLYTEEGTVFIGQAFTVRAGITTVGAVTSSQSAAVLGARAIYAASATFVSDVDGISGSVTLHAGANITITDNSPTAGEITIAATGGGPGSSPLTTKGDLYTYDTADQRLGVGADGKVLTADSSKATGLDWKTPTAPPSVPLTTKGDILGYDTANNRVPVGADGKVLTADSSKALGLDWKVPFASPLTTKGDLLGYDTANNRVPVGVDGKVLVADSSKALGVDWKAGVGTGSTIIEKPDGVIDGDNRFFTLTYTPSTTRIALFIDGQRVAAQTDYYRTGKNVTLQAYATKPRGSVLAIYTTLDTVTVPGPGNPEGPVPGTASTWTTETIGSKNWNSVCWSPDLKLFCAVASDTGTQSIATSPDGVNWTLQTIPNTPIDGGWKGICWGNGQFVVMNNLADEFSITTLTSPDGVTWTQHGYSVWPTTYGWGWDAVVWSQRFGYYVAVQDFNTSGIDKCAATSPDGANWTLRNTPATQDYFQSICWSPEKNLFVAGGTSSGGNVFLMTSPDGITWTGQTPPTYTAGFGALTRVIWVAELGLFLACGTFNPGVVGTSPDGVTWTNVSVTLGGYGAGALVWSPVRQLLILGGIDAGLHSIKTSTDGSTWHTESVPIAPNNLDLAAGDAPDVIVSVGSGGSCMISLS